jgi:hypothetical protein
MVDPLGEVGLSEFHQGQRWQNISRPRRLDNLFQQIVEIHRGQITLKEDPLPGWGKNLIDGLSGLQQSN